MGAGGLGAGAVLGAAAAAVVAVAWMCAPALGVVDVARVGARRWSCAVCSELARAADVGSALAFAVVELDVALGATVAKP